MLTVRKRISANLNGDASLNKNIRGKIFHTKNKMAEFAKSSRELLHLEFFFNDNFVTERPLIKQRSCYKDRKRFETFRKRREKDQLRNS